jgi:hypothetical protein
MHSLEIYYQIIKHFTPQQILTPELMEKNAVERLWSKEKSIQNHEKFIRSLRHGKFGTQLQIKRDDGSSKTVTNIYQK